MLNDTHSARTYIEEQLATLPSQWQKLARVPLDIELFHSCPGSTTGHHKQYGGLLIHTAQVLKLLVAFVRGLDTGDIEQDLERLHCAIIAAIWHDVGKVYCYMPVYVGGGELEFVDKATQRTHTDTYHSHIVKGYEMFRNEALSQGFFFNDPVIDQVSHMILSHHGRREWGSPVLPQNALAMQLHMADDLSAKFFP